MEKHKNILELSTLFEEIEGIKSFYKSTPYTPKTKSIYGQKKKEHSKIILRLFKVQRLMSSIEEAEKQLKNQYAELLNELEIKTTKDLSKYEFILEHEDDAINMRALKERINLLTNENINLRIANKSHLKKIKDFIEEPIEDEDVTLTAYDVVIEYFDKVQKGKVNIQKKTLAEKIYKWMLDKYPTIDNISKPTINKELSKEDVMKLLKNYF